MIDPATGMPHLPHGHRWKITPVDGRRYRHSIAVKLQRRILGIWITFGWVMASEPPLHMTHEAYARHRAQHLLDDLYGPAPDLSHLHGTYPPKTLTDSEQP